MEGSGITQNEDSVARSKNFFTYLPGEKEGRCVAEICDSAPTTRDDVGELCLRRISAVIASDDVDSNGNAFDTTKESEALRDECVYQMQQPLADGGLAEDDEDVEEFLKASSWTNNCPILPDQQEACSAIRERHRTSPPPETTQRATTGETTTDQGEEKPRPTNGMEPERGARSTMSSTIKDRVGQWMLARLESTFLPSNQANSRDTWWKKGKELFREYTAYVKNLEQPYPQIERAAVLSNQWRMEANQLRLEQEQEVAWQYQMYFGLAMAGATVITLLGSLVSLAQACGRIWNRWTGRRSDTAQPGRPGKRTGRSVERKTDCGSSSDEGDGDCQPMLMTHSKRGQQTALAIEQGGGKWYVDPAACKGTSSLHFGRSSKHSPLPQHPPQERGERGQKRPPGTTIALIPRPPVIQVLESDGKPVAAEASSHPQTPGDGAQKETDFMVKVKEGLKYLNSAEASLEG